MQNNVTDMPNKVDMADVLLRFLFIINLYACTIYILSIYNDSTMAQLLFTSISYTAQLLLFFFLIKKMNKAKNWARVTLLIIIPLEFALFIISIIYNATIIFYSLNDLLNAFVLCIAFLAIVITNVGSFQCLLSKEAKDWFSMKKNA